MIIYQEGSRIKLSSAIIVKKSFAVNFGTPFFDHTSNFSHTSLSKSYTQARDSESFCVKTRYV